MSTEIDINLFLNLRFDQECLELDSSIVNIIIDSFSINDNKYKKYKNQPKNHKMFLKIQK